MAEEESIKTQLNKVLELLEKEKEEKKFRLPFWKRTKGVIQSKMGYLLVFYIKNNLKIVPKFVKAEDNVIKIKGLYHEASADHIMYYKRFPTIIVPEWNMKPISPRENFQEAKDKGQLSFVEKVIISKMERDLLSKKKLNLGAVLLVLGLIGGLLLALNYFKII